MLIKILAKMFSISVIFLKFDEIGAVQKCSNFVDHLKKTLQNECLLAKSASMQPRTERSEYWRIDPTQIDLRVLRVALRVALRISLHVVSRRTITRFTRMDGCDRPF